MHMIWPLRHVTIDADKTDIDEKKENNKQKIQINSLIYNVRFFMSIKWSDNNRRQPDGLIGYGGGDRHC